MYRKLANASNAVFSWSGIILMPSSWSVICGDPQYSGRPYQLQQTMKEREYDVT